MPIFRNAWCLVLLLVLPGMANTQSGDSRPGAGQPSKPRVYERSVAGPGEPVRPAAQSSERLDEHTEFTAVLESLQYTNKGTLLAHVTFINKTDQTLSLIPGQPQAEKILAHDARGVLFQLTRSLGMERSNITNLPLRQLGAFLKVPPHGKGQATFELAPIKMDGGTPGVNPPTRASAPARHPPISFSYCVSYNQGLGRVL